ncbi:MAG: nucleotidyltransferase [Candidatus Scalindua rubra]|uniref:Nucleotidyltransferase n=1 Tax=Candidatus Scalindua rubra TaxID=1872076 RepID=A0A1E3XGC1_9BACT|nr:MAG: nucleotidyltransferase [Candidatus Scalindua rubra]
MAQIPAKVREIIDKYLVALKDNNIPVNQAILFGSYAKGNYDDWSDIDLVIVSEIFEGIRIKDRSKIRLITLKVSSNIEVLPYSPQDFKTDDPFVKEIMETGIKIK